MVRAFSPESYSANFLGRCPKAGMERTFGPQEHQSEQEWAVSLCRIVCLHSRTSAIRRPLFFVGWCRLRRGIIRRKDFVFVLIIIGVG